MAYYIDPTAITDDVQMGDSVDLLGVQAYAYECKAKAKDYLDYLAAKYPFSLDAVVAYALRLLLIERELSRGFDKGLDVFNSMVANAIETADNTRM